MNRVSVRPELLRWAVDRSGRREAEFQKRFPKFVDWERGSTDPTFRQLEAFAKAARTPIGYLFLDEPPTDKLPINDFRTKPFSDIAKPSPDLLDTIYLCQQRQAWYREELLASGAHPLSFVGSLNTTAHFGTAAHLIRGALAFDVSERRFSRPDAAFRQFVELAEGAGVLVMVSGIVGSNTRRTLNPDEFRGFALVDRIAPVIFVNGADAKSAQSFTLAHELAHIWLGESGVSNVGVSTHPDHLIELWCNQVAAELLVPRQQLIAAFDPSHETRVEINRLANVFKVSRIVLLKSAYDTSLISTEIYSAIYEQEVQRFRSIKQSGGNSINNVAPRASRRFAESIIVSTLEGRTSFTDCFRMLGISSHSTFEKVSEKLKIGN